MLINQDEIKEYFSGYIETEIKDGYTYFYRFSESQRDFYENEGMYYGLQSRFPAGVKISVNKCKKISFDFLCSDKIREPLSFGVIGEGGIDNTYNFDVDEGTLELFFEEKDIVVYLPYFAQVGLKNINIDGSPATKNEKVILSFGDSITQGCFIDEPAYAYPSILGREFNADVYNFGIGGYFIRRGILNDIDLLPQKPCMVSFAYGSNDWYFQKDYKEELPYVLKKINEIYPETYVCVILPPVRQNEDAQKMAGTLADVRSDIKKEAEKYSNFTVLEAGTTLNLETDFVEDLIHPNTVGMKKYGQRLAEEIKEKINII